MTDDGLVVAMKARELGKGSVVVGDRVALAGDASGAEGSLARIVRVEPRTSALRRSADDTDPQERIIVANADQMVIVSALAEPAPNLRFIDRCLVAAYDAGLDPLLVLTKADLASPRKVRAFYTPLGLPMLTTRRPLPPRTLSRLRAALDRPDQRAHRPVRRRQVHAGEHADPGGGPDDRDSQPGDRPGQAHLVLRGGAAARRRMAHRHAGATRVRAGPREPRAGGRGVRGPGRRRGACARRAATTSPPAARWTSGPASTTPRPGSTRSAACCAAAKAPPTSPSCASATTGGFVIYESRLELARLQLADFDPQVEQIYAQPFRLAARAGGRVLAEILQAAGEQTAAIQ